MRKNILFLIGGILVLLFIAACGEINPPEEPEFEGVPGPEFTIPDSLVSSAARDRSTPDTESVFEPFRFGLYFAQECVNLVREIIQALNENTIPDNGEIITGEDELIVITTDESREYATMIEVYTGAEAIPADKYMQISYTKGINKGEAVFDVDTKEPASEVDMVKIYYDGTGEEPVLKGWLTFNYDGSDPYVIYPVSVYFNASKDNNIVTIEGGVAYHYYFDNDESYGADKTYVDDHVYMFKAMADVDEEKAIVHLYFPRKDILLSAIEDWEISESMLYILYEWLIMAGNADVKLYLEETFNGDDTIDDAQELYTIIDDNRDDVPPELIFILDLDNPIAYSATNGYEANGLEVPTEYTDIGNIASVSFSEEPADIFGMDITF